MKQNKIGLLLPEACRDQDLTCASNLSLILSEGAAQAGSSVQIVLACQQDFDPSLNPSTPVREYRLKILDRQTSEIALEYAGRSWKLSHAEYTVFDDELNYMMDCDLLIIFSSNFTAPLLPLYKALYLVQDLEQNERPSISPELILHTPLLESSSPQQSSQYWDLIKGLL